MNRRISLRPILFLRRIITNDVTLIKVVDKADIFIILSPCFPVNLIQLDIIPSCQLGELYFSQINIIQRGA